MNLNFFKHARKCSLLSDYSGCGQARIGCVVVYHGTILAKGYNSDSTHPWQKRYNRKRYKDAGNRYLPDKAHAEVSALSKIKYLDIDFSKVELYIYRELRNGDLAMSRPCEACFAAIRDLGIKKIFYTTPDGYAAEVLIQTKK